MGFVLFARFFGGKLIGGEYLWTDLRRRLQKYLPSSENEKVAVEIILALWFKDESVASTDA